jgi:hypothetical protein
MVISSCSFEQVVFLSGFPVSLMDDWIEWLVEASA